MRKPNVLGIEIRTVADAVSAAEAIHEEINLAYRWGPERPQQKILLERSAFAAGVLQRELKKLIAKLEGKGE